MSADAAARRRNPTWVVVAVAGLVGLFYAYVVFAGIDLLVRQAGGPLGLSALGWFVHILAVVVPMALFGASFAIGHRRAPWQFALILVCGLTLSAAFWVNIVAYGVTSYSLYGG
jgi:hypothetical protein